MVSWCSGPRLFLFFNLPSSMHGFISLSKMTAPDSITVLHHLKGRKAGHACGNCIPQTRTWSCGYLLLPLLLAVIIFNLSLQVPNKRPMEDCETGYLETISYFCYSIARKIVMSPKYPFYLT